MMLYGILLEQHTFDLNNSVQYPMTMRISYVENMCPFLGKRYH